MKLRKAMLASALLMQYCLAANGFNIQPVLVDVQLPMKKQMKGSSYSSQSYVDHDYLHQKERIYFDTIPVNLDGVWDSQLQLYRNEYYNRKL